MHLYMISINHEFYSFKSIFQSLDIVVGIKQLGLVDTASITIQFAKG